MSEPSFVFLPLHTFLPQPVQQIAYTCEHAMQQCRLDQHMCTTHPAHTLPHNLTLCDVQHVARAVDTPCDDAGDVNAVLGEVLHETSLACETVNTTGGYNSPAKLQMRRVGAGDGVGWGVASVGVWGRRGSVERRSTQCLGRCCMLHPSPARHNGWLQQPCPAADAQGGCSGEGLGDARGSVRGGVEGQAKGRCFMLHPSPARRSTQRAAPSNLPSCRCAG